MIDLAVRSCRINGAPALSDLHLLLGVLATGDSKAIAPLEPRGARADGIREAVIAALARG